MIHFNSDYMAGAHPEVMRRLVETNMEQTVGYGMDAYTIHAKDLIREACNTPNAAVHLLVGGTQTNATVIDALLRRHEGVLAAETAHIFSEQGIPSVFGFAHQSAICLSA